MSHNTPQSESEAPLIPGVDYDVLTPEELAAELAQPDPGLGENDAHVLATGGKLPTGEGGEIIPLEEARKILARLPDSFF